ncbi:MAG TPA: hypothetical protein VF824_09540 [Thermoanaerobaculia bacterium]|jgi:hypothetical protein
MRRALFGLLVCLALRADAATLRLVWEHSSSPAVGIEAVAPAGDERTAIATFRATSSADGSITVPDGMSVGLVEPRTRVRLTTVTNASGDATIRVPELVRVRGRVQRATAAGPLTVLAGSGERQPLAAFLAGGGAKPRGDARAEDGGVATHWLRATADAGGRFETPWFPARGALQLVAVDESGASAASDLGTASIAPGATIDAGTLALAPPIAVTLRVEPSDEAEGSVPVGVTFDRATAPQSLHALALAAVRPAAARLFAGHTIDLAPGSTTTIEIPAIARNATFYAVGPVVGAGDRQTLAPDSTEITFRAKKVYPFSGATADVTGRLTLEGTARPVAGATIVASGHRYRATARSAADGTFRLAAVPSDRPVTFDLSADDPAGHYSLSRRISLLRVRGDELRALEVAAQRRIRITGAPAVRWPLSGEVIIAGERQQSDGSWMWDRIERGDIGPESMAVIVSKPGTWRLTLVEDAFTLRRSAPVRIGAETFDAATSFAASTPARDAVLQLTDESGAPLANADLEIAPVYPDPQPMWMRTDAGGRVTLPACNVDQVELRVRTAAGTFFERVPLAGALTTIRVVPRRR